MATVVVVKTWFCYHHNQSYNGLHTLMLSCFIHLIIRSSTVCPRGPAFHPLGSCAAVRSKAAKQQRPATSFSQSNPTATTCDQPTAHRTIKRRKAASQTAARFGSASKTKTFKIQNQHHPRTDRAPSRHTAPQPQCAVRHSALKAGGGRSPSGTNRRRIARLGNRFGTDSGRAGTQCCSRCTVAQTDSSGNSMPCC